MAAQRDKRGLSPKSKPKRGTYAEERINQLRKEREKYNVNDLGYYRGGVPRKHRGAIRGEALMQPGYFHSPSVHNFIHYQHPDAQRVTAEDSV